MSIMSIMSQDDQDDQDVEPMHLRDLKVGLSKSESQLRPGLLALVLTLARSVCFEVSKTREIEAPGTPAAFLHCLPMTRTCLPA
jgi:hypothetical protein